MSPSLRRQRSEEDPLQPQGRLGSLWPAGAVALGLGGMLALGQGVITQSTDSLLPDVGGIRSFNRPGTLTVLASDGTVVYKQGPATREKLKPGRMPLLVQKAFIAAEDRRFYQHDGIDGVGILRAIGRNLSRG
ncbi:MAG: transglycosylase domain-containing protein, partial [Cyanobium sp.]